MSKSRDTRRAFLAGVSAVALFGCASGKIKKIYYGPKADGIVVRKSERKMYIMQGTTALSAHDVDLGFTPTGHKRNEGDGRTPEGQYFINRRNYNSAYFLSLGISYPNASDVARARAAGVRPGGDIFIHGGPRYFGEKGKRDWTAGCIAVTDAEMEQIYQMVPDGTPIWIQA